MERAYLVLSLAVCVAGCGASDERGNFWGTGDGDGAGAGGGAAGGGGSGSGAGNAGGVDGVCQSYIVGNQRIEPDMLIVLDRSASMDIQQNGIIDRWNPSVSGIQDITSGLSSAVRFGLMTFPHTNPACASGDVNELLQCLQSLGGSAGCEPGEVDVPIGDNTARAIRDALQSTVPGGYTPTAQSLAAAASHLERDFAPDVVTRPAYVILVTDGAPNCSGGRFDAGQLGAFGQDPQAVQATVAQIATMAEDGIKTYVLGYGSDDDAALKGALDSMAQAGGTGDEEHRLINDRASLAAEFRKITGQAISCEFALEQPVDDPRYVSVKVDGFQLPYGEEDGFRVTEDGSSVTVQGEPCTWLQAKGQHSLQVTVECEVVNVSVI